ncbi:hypothetical protein MHK_000458, partial [Candidatus Magnetomorum sp. HK-1]
IETKPNDLTISGQITISAKDDASIDAKTNMKSISSTTNDGGASMLGGLVDAIMTDYKYSSKSGTQTVEKDHYIRVASDHDAGGVTGGIYRYKGTESASIDLDAEDFSVRDTWERITRSSASDTIPNIGNVTSSDSQAFGGIVVRNDLRSSVQSYIQYATINSAGDINISAEESATINANDESTVTSSGGSAYGTGKSDAVNGIIATNLVLSKANAFITDSDVTTTAGDLTVDAKNTSAINATINSSTSSGDKAIGVTLAFNTIGWEAQNVLFRAIDALLGTSIGNEQPAETKAYIEDTTLNIAGDVSVTADNSAFLNATISNAADSQASALYGAGGTAASAMLASNMVSTDAKAYIDFTETGTITVTGTIDISAQDKAGIYSNTKIVSSSITTNDGGASLANETIGDLMDANFL